MRVNGDGAVDVITQSQRDFHGLTPEVVVFGHGIALNVVDMAKVRAPELVGAGGWIGASEQLSLASLRGRVVVLGFFAFGSVESHRMLADLAEIERRWPTEAVVIGVHSPKFPHEADYPELVQAVARLGITHPVLDDPEMVTWQQYGVKGWPTAVVVDARGFIVGAASGEGNGPLLLQVVSDTLERHRRRRTLVPATMARVPPVAQPSLLAFPAKVASDRRNRVAIADTGHDRVLVAELITIGDRPGVRARLTHVVTGVQRPQGVRLYGRELVICDTGGDRVVRVDLAKRPAHDETIEPDPAGLIRLRVLPQEVLANDLASPWDVALDIDRSFVVAEAGRHRLWRVPNDGRAPGVIAGDRYQGLLDGSAAQAELAQPSGLTRVAAGMVFVDAESSSLRILTKDGKIGTLAGDGLYDWGLRDGRGSRARMQHPQGVAASLDGRVLYIADSYNSKIRSWVKGDLSTLPAEGLASPGGLDVLPDGRLIVADTNNHRLVIVDPELATVEEVVFETMRLAAAEALVGPGVALSAQSGTGFAVPFEVDLGPYRLDPGPAAPVSIAVDCSPAWLLDQRARTWVHERRSGVLTVGAGTVGSGWLTVTVAAAVHGDAVSTVRRSVTRHPLTVR